MVVVKTFADLKRTIKPGMTLRVVQHNYRPELTGTLRLVTKVQTTGYYFTMEGSTGRSWSGFSKASSYSFPAPDTYRQDEGIHCSCGHTEEGPHDAKCNLRTGKRYAWTIRVESEVRS